MKKPSTEAMPGKNEERRKINAQQAGNLCIISPGPKCQSYNRKIDLMSTRHYTIKKAPGAHLDYCHRLTLQTAWNRYINAGARISLKVFAKMHGMSTETWRREYHRGAAGATVKVKGRWQYATYSANQAQAGIDSGQANMGTPMKLTAPVANQFRILVCEKKLSPYDARETLREMFPDAYIPCLRTFYNHIDAGDIGVARGETPYHPGKKKRPPGKPHPAKTLPNRRRISERPAEAAQHSEPGYIEFDTVVSCAGGSGGLLTVVDDHTRRLAMEKVNAVSQEEVSAALRRAIDRGAIDRNLKAGTTDNGTEVSHQEELEAILGCLVYYTRAYASYEKGAIENVNRIIRRWFPKGTDFSKVPEAEIRAVEEIINSIHRKSLGGLSANAYHKKLKSAA